MNAKKNSIAIAANQASTEKETYWSNIYLFQPPKNIASSTTFVAKLHLE